MLRDMKIISPATGDMPLEEQVATVQTDVSRTSPDLNGDVLHELMLYCSSADQATAALVCTRWTFPAQKALYRTITFHTWSYQNTHMQLPDTLQRYPHLRALVRQICVHASQRQLTYCPSPPPPGEYPRRHGCLGIRRAVDDDPAAMLPPRLRVSSEMSSLVRTTQ